MIQTRMVVAVILYGSFPLAINLQAQHTKWSDLRYGHHIVGFETIRMNSSNGNPMLIGVWYPAQATTRALTLRDFITMDPRQDVSGDVLVAQYRAPIEWMFDQKMDSIRFLNLIEISTNANLNAKQKEGSYPLVIALARPSSYFGTFEFLASHGYIVAGLDCRFDGDPPPPPHHYTRHTDVMLEFLSFMEKQPGIQKDAISVLGHGFGINPALYLAMQTKKIKKAVNLDGGFFGPRSKTTASYDYHPDNLQIPLLHVVTLEQSKEDDPVQFNALSNPITRVTILQGIFKHQDVSAWGRLVTLGMRPSEDARIVNHVYVELHELILDFLTDKPLRKTSSDLLVEKFN